MLPYVDASTRREPDFEHPLSPISSVCRGENFAPRLQPGDTVVYMTVGTHLLTAVLKVREVADSHANAAIRCLEYGFTLPSNCLVAGNDPLPLNLTGGRVGMQYELSDLFRRNDTEGLARFHQRWDAAYRARTRDNPKIALTHPHFLSLVKPEKVEDSLLKEAFEYIPGTLNPKRLDSDRMNYLLEKMGIPAIG